MADQGIYLYCIIGCSEERTFDGVTPIGQAQGPVFTIAHHGLAAVVSDSPLREYETTRANMLAHQRVLERVMKEFTLLPVRFDTVAGPPSPLTDIRHLLQARTEEFIQLLADMEGKVELGLKARWLDDEAIFEEVMADNPTLRHLRDSLRDKPPMVVRYQGIALGKGVKAALDQKRKVQADELLARLRPLAHNIQENGVLGDRMILNAAFLVDKGREREFDRAVDQLQGELGNRVGFRYVGPVPPYNFVNIVVNWEEL